MKQSDYKIITLHPNSDGSLNGLEPGWDILHVWTEMNINSSHTTQHCIINLQIGYNNTQAGGMDIPLTTIYSNNITKALAIRTDVAKLLYEKKESQN